MKVPRLLMIPISDIVVRERIRSDLGDVRGLAENIEAIGLIHPIAVAIMQGCPGKYILLSGQRRVEAFRFLGRTEIPAILHDSQVCSSVGGAIDEAD